MSMHLAAVLCRYSPARVQVPFARRNARRCSEEACPRLRTLRSSAGKAASNRPACTLAETRRMAKSDCVKVKETISAKEASDWW